MKRYNLYTFLVCLTLSFLFNACQDEEMVAKKKEILSGIPVGLSISFTQDDASKVMTKVGISEDAEKEVYDIRVFVFDEDKKLEYVTPSIPISQEPLKSKKIEIEKGKIASGNKYIYAIANTSSTLGSFYTGHNSIDLSDDTNIYTNIKKLSDLTSLTYIMNKATEQRLSGRLVMGGYFQSNALDSEQGACAVDANDAKDGVVAVNGVIELVRVDSKIQFNVAAAKGITFVPKKWKVVNMPTTTYVFGGQEDAEGDYKMSELNEFDDNNIVDTQYKGGSFTFYMYENRKAPQKALADYSMREYESEKGATQAKDPRVYEYANNNSAYVVLTGSYSDGNKTTAEVTYRIHLGYLNGASDFNSARNTDYTYTVTVTGVENIILEVTDDTEKQPGAEGSVMVADQNILVDSHYEARVVTFLNNDETTISDLSVQISTPFDEGSYKIGNDGSLVEGKLGHDYKWVKFVRNEKGDDGKYKRNLALYPGDGKALKMTEIDGDFSVDGDDTKNYLTIDQLLWQLYKNKDNSEFWDTEGEVCYTAFIDEYYYDKHPVTGATSTTLWKDFANAPNRKMHILCDTKYSDDKQSSLTTSNILINQRSIKTVYNLDKSLTGLTTAWGIETVDETPNKYYSDKKTVSSETRTNGRYLTFKIAGNDMLSDYWSNYIDFTLTENDKLQNDYNKAEYACMQRNRDLNGDGMVSADEIRWYLPATNQYTALWIGKDALDPEARLFQVDPSSVVKIKSGKLNQSEANREWDMANSRGHFHYVSSNGMRFWSEQGASVGNTVFPVHGLPYKFRCARNLGFSYSSELDGETESSDIVGENYDDYVQREGNILNLEYLNPSARRSLLETNQLASSGEHKGADLNRPYKKFEVYSENTPTRGCPPGYRVPNQREIALIAGYFANLGSVRIESNTHTDLSNASYSDKLGFVYSIQPSTTGGLNEVTLVSKSGNTRCVRDTD